MKNYELVLHHIQNKVLLEEDELLEALKSLYNEKDNTHKKVCMSLILYGLSVRIPTNTELKALISFVKYLEPDIFEQKAIVKIGKPIVGVAGSGKKGVKTFNISTIAAIVAASIGCYISKNVSKSVSSVTGSSDILIKAGANLDLSHEKMIRLLKETGIGMFQIEKSIPKFDEFYGGTFLVPHALSYALAMIVNPINCDSVVYGLSGTHTEISSAILKDIGYKKGVVVSSTNDKKLFIDELTPLRYNKVSYIHDSETIDEFNTQDVFGNTLCTPDELKSGTNIEEQLTIFNNILNGKGNKAQKDAIAMNSALFLNEAGIASSLSEGFNMSLDALASGKASIKFKDFCEASKDLGREV